MYNRCGIYEKDGKHIRLVQSNHTMFETRHVVAKTENGATTYHYENATHRPKVINGTKDEVHKHLIDNGYKKVAER